VARRTLALAGLVMARKLPVRLSLLVPAVENAVGPNALRPGEVVITRAGISVEVDNTDAEGRLILCDALARAGELQADAILDFATLTGAAAWRSARTCRRCSPTTTRWPTPGSRPATRCATRSGACRCGARTCAISTATWPTWPTPARAWPARSPPRCTWSASCRRARRAHLDTYAWTDADRPGHPAGGEALGLRAAWAMLKQRYAR
jgi:leucyl aminopeptidase